MSELDELRDVARATIEPLEPCDAVRIVRSVTRYAPRTTRISRINGFLKSTVVYLTDYSPHLDSSIFIVNLRIY